MLHLADMPALIQGVTEFLPISSTLHLSLWAKFQGQTITQLEEIWLHTGTLIALTLYFLRPKRFPSFLMIMWTIIATIPTIAVGYIWKRLGVCPKPYITLIASFIGGALLSIVDYKKLQNKPLNLERAFYIGLAQIFAFIPGVSRMGSTVTMARLLGLDRLSAIRFSWMLAIPAIAGALVLTTYDAYKAGELIISNQTWRWIALTAAIGLCVMHTIEYLLARFSLVSIGIYRMILAITLWYFYF